MPKKQKASRVSQEAFLFAHHFGYDPDDDQHHDNHNNNTHRYPGFEYPGDDRAAAQRE